MKLKLWRLKVWKKNYQGKPNVRRLFMDIATCPICTQDKPVDEFTVREISHIEAHIQHPLVE